MGGGEQGTGPPDRLPSPRRGQKSPFWGGQGLELPCGFILAQCLGGRGTHRHGVCGTHPGCPVVQFPPSSTSLLGRAELGGGAIKK